MVQCSKSICIKADRCVNKAAREQIVSLSARIWTHRAGQSVSSVALVPLSILPSPFLQRIFECLGRKAHRN